MIRPVLILIALATALLHAETRLGKPFTLSKAVPVETLLANAGQSAGKLVQVKGKVTEVCQMMGCWMALAGADGAILRIKVADGEIVFPKSSVGKLAIAEGKLQKLELNRAQAIARAKHEAEEQGRAFDASSVKTGATVWQVQGTSAVLLD